VTTSVDLQTAPATGLGFTPGDYGFAPGERLGRHVLIERIGGGGMGVVYAAYDPKLDRRVALKLLRPDAARNPHAHAQLEREAQALARLAHPNVVNVHDISEIDGRVFVEMELVQGTTLSVWLAEPRTWRAIVDVLAQAGRGLAAAHAVGIVHRDFKPDNVLVGEDGRVRVADFGIALLAEGKERDPVGLSPTVSDGSTPPVAYASGPTGARIGTPAYMAPEQRSGTTSARSDQYSFTLVLREALAGASPRAALPAWLERAIAKGLSPSPDDRHPSMDALLAVLASGPRRTRRRLGGVAALVGLAGLGLVSAVALRAGSRGLALCSGADREMSAVWGEPQQRAIAAEFAATSLPYADQAARETTATLDRYAREWVSMHDDACEATRVRGEQSDALMETRMQCLDRRLAEVRTLADVLAKGDVKVVARSVQAAQALSPIADCSAAHERAVSLRIVRPIAPEDAPIVQELGRAFALDAAGKLEDARGTAEEALQHARASGAVGLQAQALQLAGTVASQQGDGPRSERLLFDAFVAAGESGDDTVAARAATMSVFAIGYLQNRAEEADKWFRLSGLAIERMGGDDSLSVRRLYSMSAVEWSAGHFQAAADQARDALRLAEERLPHGSIETGYCLTGLGNSLMSQGKTDEARTYLEKALAFDEETLGPDHPDVEMDVFNMGNLVRADGRYDDARKLYERALSIGEKLNRTSSMIAISHGAVAGTLMRLGMLEEARVHVNRGITMGEGISGFEKGRLANLYATRGIIERLGKHYDDAEHDLDRAIDIVVEQSGKDDPDLSDPIVELARVFLERGRPKKAIPLLERALVLAKDMGDSELAMPQLALAQALLETGGDRARSENLIEEAHAFYDRQPARRIEVAEIEQWLASAGAIASPHSALVAVGGAPRKVLLTP
jgi:serine/threonine protein kinase/tetratricopeptide (TPR) repeat protein